MTPARTPTPLSMSKAARLLRTDDFVDGHIGLGRDEPGTITAHLNGAVVDALLEARGWTIEPVPGGRRYLGPRERVDCATCDGATRTFDDPADCPDCDGARYVLSGRLRCWHASEALELALTAEALR